MAEKGKGSFGAQVAAVVLILVICVLCFPMPGGGLLITRLSGTDYVQESKPVAAVPVPVTAEVVDAPVIAAAPPLQPPKVQEPTRFAQTLDIFPAREKWIIPADPADPADPLSSETWREWVEVTVEGKKAWVSAGMGMVWGPRLDVELSGMAQEDLDLARSLCEKEKPVGAWALPTATEFDYAKVGGILKADSDAKHKWLAWIRIPNTADIPAVRGYGQAASGDKYSVRCIARTPKAPDNGYVMTDNTISLQAMNE